MKLETLYSILPANVHRESVKKIHSFIDLLFMHLEAELSFVMNVFYPLSKRYQSISSSAFISFLIEMFSQNCFRHDFCDLSNSTLRLVNFPQSKLAVLINCVMGYLGKI